MLRDRLAASLGLGTRRGAVGCASGCGHASHSRVCGVVRAECREAWSHMNGEGWGCGCEGLAEAPCLADVAAFDGAPDASYPDGWWPRVVDAVIGDDATLYKRTLQAIKAHRTNAKG